MAPHRRRPQAKPPLARARPAESEGPSLLELDRFNHASLQIWLRMAEDLGRLQTALYLGLESSRQEQGAALLDALRTGVYAAIHAFRTGEGLDLGAAEIQGMDGLIRLRNAVVHFKPEWFEEQTRHAKLSGQLHYKFEGSPFLPGERLFPRAWASHSFAVWALRSTVGFLDHFYGQIRQPCPLAPFRARLTTLSDGAV